MKTQTLLYTALAALTLGAGSAGAQKVAHAPAPAVSTAEVIKMWQPVCSAMANGPAIAANATRPSVPEALARFMFFSRRF